MPIIEWADANGRKRWQPELENGKRLWTYWGGPYVQGWLTTWDDADAHTRKDVEPALFSKREARHQVKRQEWRIRSEQLRETGNVE